MKNNLTSWIMLIIAITCVYSFILHPIYAAEDILVALNLDYQSYLEYEDIPAKVTIHNKKNLPIIIDTEDKDNKNQLTFIIQRLPNTLIHQTRTVPLVKDLMVLPDEKVTTSIDVSRWYPINSAGRYMLTAVVTYEGRNLESNTVMIDIVPGIEITSQTREIPYSDGKSRKYSIRYWSRKGREYLFLRVDNIQENGSHIVFNLGPLIRVTTPTMEVDRKGNVIIWHQQDKLCFVRTVLRSTIDEVSVPKQTFHLQDGTPYPLPPSP